MAASLEIVREAAQHLEYFLNGLSECGVIDSYSIQFLESHSVNHALLDFFLSHLMTLRANIKSILTKLDPGLCSTQDRGIQTDLPDTCAMCQKNNAPFRRIPRRPIYKPGRKSKQGRKPASRIEDDEYGSDGQGEELVVMPALPATDEELDSDLDMQDDMDESGIDTHSVLLLNAYRYMLNKTYPENCPKHDKRSIRRKSTRFSIKDGKVFYEKNGKILRYVIGESERKKILKTCHEGNNRHYNSRKTLALVTEEFIWPGVAKDTRALVENCENCPRGSNRRSILESQTLQRVTVVAPWQHLGIDFMGPLVPPSKQGNCYILTIMDYFSKYAQAIPLVSKDALAVSSELHKIFMKFGIPKAITSDQGKKFNYEFDMEMKKLLKIDYPMTTLYRPKGDGLIEQFKQTLQGSLVKCVAEKMDCWEDYLDACIYKYNTTKPESAKYTPHEVHFGRKTIPALDVTYNGTSSETVDYSGIITEVDEKNIKLEPVILSKYKVGALVLKKDLTNKIRCGGKLNYMWQGPFRVTRAHGRGLYGLESVSDPSNIVSRVRGAHLKPFSYPSQQPDSKNPATLNLCGQKSLFKKDIKHVLSTVRDGKGSRRVAEDENAVKNHEANFATITQEGFDSVPIKVERICSSPTPSEGQDYEPITHVTIEAAESSGSLHEVSTVVIKGGDISPLDETIDKATIEIHSGKMLDGPVTIFPQPPMTESKEFQWEVMNVINSGCVEQSSEIREPVEYMEEDDENALLEKALQYLTENTYPFNCSKQEKKSVRRKSKRLVSNDGQVFYKKRNGTYARYIMDPDERIQVMRTCHVDATTHLGTKRTLNRVTEEHIWQGVSHDVHTFVENCKNCPRRGRRKRSTLTPKTELSPKKQKLC